MNVQLAAFCVRGRVAIDPNVCCRSMDGGFVFNLLSSKVRNEMLAVLSRVVLNFVLDERKYAV